MTTLKPGDRVTCVLADNTFGKFRLGREYEVLDAQDHLGTQQVVIVGALGWWDASRFRLPAPAAKLLAEAAEADLSRPYIPLPVRPPVELDVETVMGLLDITHAVDSTMWHTPQPVIRPWPARRF
jgi:hypothetical protein